MDNGNQMSNTTIIIPTSPIPLHPSTAIIDETISNIRKYTDAKIIIMCDGVHESLRLRTEAYDEYRMRLQINIADGKYGDCEAVEFLHHRHQSEMFTTVLKDVTTPTILFCEHDCSVIGDVPFDAICNMVASSQLINYLRFNIFAETPKEHLYLMLDAEPITIDGIPLVRTIQYSARPNIAKTRWYRDLLYTYFEGRYEMIEDRIHGIIQAKYNALGYDTFGMAIYAPEGNQLRSYHSDARGSDEKIITS